MRHFLSALLPVELLPRRVLYGPLGRGLILLPGRSHRYLPCLARTFIPAVPVTAVAVPAHDHESPASPAPKVPMPTVFLCVDISAGSPPTPACSPTADAVASPRRFRLTARQLRHRALRSSRPQRSPSSWAATPSNRRRRVHPRRRRSCVGDANTCCISCKGRYGSGSRLRRALDLPAIVYLCGSQSRAPTPRWVHSGEHRWVHSR